MNVLELSLFLMLLLVCDPRLRRLDRAGTGGVGFAAVSDESGNAGGQVLATSMWTASNSWDLTALPMFIWMGEILYRTKLSDDMFEGLAPWLQKLPGRLLHVNVVGCAIFAAVSGSSAATCATIGRIASAGTAQARLRRAHGDRHARRLRHARAADPAVDHHDRLRDRHRSIDRAAVHRRRHSRTSCSPALFMGFIVGMGAAQQAAHAAAGTAGAVPRSASTRRAA